MFTAENVPSLVRAVKGTGRILIVSVPSQSVVSKVKDAILEMRAEQTIQPSSVSNLFHNAAMLDEDQIIVLTDATASLNGGSSEDFIQFMSIAQRRDYKAAVVAIVVLDSYDSHAAQYCINVRVS